MARTPSPLRYPGGKSSLFQMVSEILRLNKIGRGCYVEPFAGGGGLALSLLFRGEVTEIYLNDIDPAISALWRAMLERSDDLIEVMRRTPVTLEERERQKQIYTMQAGCDVTLGFATLFLNRVNRSGIIKTGGVIGGLKQTGNYLMDCRFNKDDIEARIRRIASYASQISFRSVDAGLFMKQIVKDLPERTLIYADPPYYAQGAELYTSSFKPTDHVIFRDQLFEIDAPWILTYDNTPEIEIIYKSRRQYTFNINYSAQTKRLGSELLIVSKGLYIPTSLSLQSTSKPQYRKTLNAASL